MYARVINSSIGRISSRTGLSTAGRSTLSAFIIARQQPLKCTGNNSRSISSCSGPWSKHSAVLADIRRSTGSRTLNGVRFSSTLSNQTETLGVAPLAATPEITLETSSALANTAVTEAATATAASGVSEAAANAALHIGDFKAMGLVNYTPVGAVEALLEATQVWTGMPWWLTIPAVTILVRAAMVPIMAAQQRNTVALHNVNPEMEIVKKKLLRSQRDKDSASIAIHSQEIRTLFEKHNVSPVRTLFLSMSQIPVFLSFFMALRSMSEIPVPQLTVGGLWWFENLAAADPTYVFPILSSLSFLVTSELNMYFNPNVAMSPNLKLAMRILPAAMVWFTASFPVSLHIYWLTSSIFSILQILAFRAPWVRNFLRIPETIQHAKAFVRK
ncbi:60Kd inner membrane protein-domain-containing protein [Syncephalis fuscata]|nr:60Kd inner membrane protein-domain-containing protein [Syncephalis fuscata]